MNFLYPQYCNNPKYVQNELTDEEFFSCIKESETDIIDCASKKDYDKAWELYLKKLSDNIDKRCIYRLTEADAIKEYVEKNFSDEEKSKILKPADDLTNYRFALHEDDPFDFSENEVPWNGDLGNSPYNQLILTYMGYLGQLGSAYIVTRDDKYVRFFATLINDFIAHCPVPIADDFAYECSTYTRFGAGSRLTHITSNFAAMFDSEAFDADIKKRIIKYLVQAARYIRKYHAVDGNHVNTQMGGLTCAAAFLAELKESDEWMSYATQKIEKELDVSVYKDGVQAEASPNYHMGVMSNMLNLKALSLNGCDGIPESLTGRIHKMFLALKAMCAPDNYLVNLGDTPCIRNSSSLLKLASCMYPDEFRDVPEARISFHHLCLFGAELCSKPGKNAEFENMFVLEDSGYLSYKSDDGKNADFMFMHAGDGINGHAHADTLSVILYANGRNILLDSGVAEYNWDKERKYILSTAAHNTVRVDGEDSHVRMLHWLPMRTAPCKIWVCEETDDYVLFFASHYGYHRLTDPVVHTRKLIYVKDGGYYIILDLMNAEEYHSYEVFYHLPVGEVVFNPAEGRVRTVFDDANVMICPAVCSDNTIELTNTPFYREHMESYMKPVVKISSKCSGNKYFATLVIPYASKVPSVEIKEISAFKDGRELSSFEATALEISVDGKKKTVAINNLSIDPREYVNHEGNPDSDAHMKGGKNSVSIECAGKEFNDEVKIF